MSTLDIGIAIVRIVVGLTFFAHGAQKAFGWWGGPGFAKWSGAMERMGLRPNGLWALASVGAEVVCGPLLALGLLTAIAAPFLVAQAIYIVFRAHWKAGFFNGNKGYEFPLQLLASSFLFVLAGPGALSLDTVSGIAFPTELRVAFFVIAVVGVLVALYTARPAAAPAPAPAPPTRNA